MTCVFCVRMHAFCTICELQETQRDPMPGDAVDAMVMVENSQAAATQERTQ